MHPRRTLSNSLQDHAPAVLTLLLVALAGCDGEKDGSASGKLAPKEPASSSAAPQVSEVKETREEQVIDPPRVLLDGRSSNLAVTTVEEGPRVYARHLRAWVYASPRSGSRRIGYLRAGSSSPTSGTASGYAGCKGGWYTVKPRGYICVGTRATLDKQDPLVTLYESNPPRTDKRLPYRYGTVRKPGPIYGRLPERTTLPSVEAQFNTRFPTWLNAKGEIGASFRQNVWQWEGAAPNPNDAWKTELSRGIPSLVARGGNLPSPLLTPRPSTLVIDRMQPRVGHAFLDTFFSEGRRYGLTTHLELVPTDRYRPIVGSTFHGVEIGKDVSFPFAFVRRVGAKFSDGEKAEYRKVLPLTGKRTFINKRLHYETASGNYISDRYASELRLAKKMPGWAKKGEKWISISINKQTMVLYEGEKAVYATLVSTGEAGLASAEETTATKRGIFRIHTKHITATMASDVLGEEFELRDVPYVQYFSKGGYALHGAYWHDRLGTPKSHGCINLSPEDARRIFHWTEPHVPRAWHGALLPLKGTVVFIHP